MQEQEEEQVRSVVKHAAAGALAHEVFTLVDGDKIGDVLFEAGEYTFEQIVLRCNRDSQKFFARIEDGLIKVREKMVPVTVDLVRGLATKRLSTAPPEPRNRHERRKAAALARRARG